jgi:hypothetical protein
MLDVVFILLLFYTGLCLVTFYEYLQLIVRENALKETVQQCNLWPSTIQLQVHIITLLFSGCRVSFFIVALYAWDYEIGEVVKDKLLFYTFDEIATILYFTLAAVITLFWAELYYISKNMESQYYNFVRPGVYFVIFIAFAGISICTWLVKADSSNDVYYIFKQYAYIISGTYLVIATFLTYYTLAVVGELKNVPVHLTQRRTRLRLLRYLGMIIISSLVVKALIVFLISGHTLPENTVMSVALVFFYYLLLELFPTVAILIFYRVEPIDYNVGSIIMDSEYDYDPNEKVGLTSPPTSDADLPTSSKKKTTSSKLNNYGRSPAPTEVINEIIDRLSSEQRI